MDTDDMDTELLKMSYLWYKITQGTLVGIG